MHKIVQDHSIRLKHDIDSIIQTDIVSYDISIISHHLLYVATFFLKWKYRIIHFVSIAQVLQIS